MSAKRVWSSWEVASEGLVGALVTLFWGSKEGPSCREISVGIDTSCPRRGELSEVSVSKKSKDVRVRHNLKKRICEKIFWKKSIRLLFFFLGFFCFLQNNFIVPGKKQIVKNFYVSREESRMRVHIAKYFLCLSYTYVV